ncbi:hypothetical protein SKAU_G00052320 [Synaphobranchus kaupii]|uniref:Uncharacterized protein n=1 Tax=Synaphobranchus kaupii TaxID=118154 RepID=A0A9Q1G4A3_SYNKA|nr:hypothetical protein SKAU_G00052320 [Synaphobranchus kaupii]
MSQESLYIWAGPQCTLLSLEPEKQGNYPGPSACILISIAAVAVWRTAIGGGVLTVLRESSGPARASGLSPPEEVDTAEPPAQGSGVKGMPRVHHNTAVHKGCQVSSKVCCCTHHPHKHTTAIASPTDNTHYCEPSLLYSEQHIETRLLDSCSLRSVFPSRKNYNLLTMVC